MPEKALQVHYVTDDCHNHRDRAELEALKYVGTVSIVTTNATAHVGGIPSVKIAADGLPSPVRRVWPKLAFLLARVPNSAINQRFPERNIYASGRIGRFLIPVWWFIKTTRLVANLLPSYTTLYHLPSRWMRLFSKASEDRTAPPKADLVVYDATLARMPKFACYLNEQRQAGAIMVANVKSWDNPFTASLDTSADCYLVWSEAMWHDIVRTHGPLTARHVVWGAIPLDTFKRTLSKRALPALPAGSRPFTIGYASAYPCPPMDAHEEAVLAAVMRHIKRVIPEARMLWRPYPTKPHFTTAEPQAAGIELATIDGTTVDRYGDGAEKITFSSDEQKLNYLDQCDCFLSIGTSFTLEAAIAGLPIIQFTLDKAHRHTTAERSLFGWVDISDHLQAYYIKHLPVYRNHDTLVAAICNLKGRHTQPDSGTAVLLNNMGIDTPMSAEERGRALARQVLDGLRSRYPRISHDA